MSELIRYKAGDAIRWLDLGSGSLKDSAKRHTRDVVERRGERGIGKDIGGIFGAAVDYGKGAVADMMHRQAEASEYILDGHSFEIHSGRSVKKVLYADVKSIRRSSDKVKFILTQGSLEIKPYAHIVAGRVRVPVGWSRNGIEVPFDLITEELAARCQVEVEEV